MSNRWSWFMLPILLAPLPALAQGSESTRGTLPRTEDSGSSFIVKRSVEGTLVALDAEQGWVVVEDEKGQKLSFKLDERLRLKADKNTDLSAKKELELADFQIGQRVKVTFRVSDNTATELRIKLPKPVA